MVLLDFDETQRLECEQEAYEVSGEFGYAYRELLNDFEGCTKSAVNSYWLLQRMKSYNSIVEDRTKRLVDFYNNAIFCAEDRE